LTKVRMCSVHSL